MGSKHLKYNFSYPINYGYIPNTKAEDGEEIDAYILGENKPLFEYEGTVIAVVNRKMTMKINLSWLIGNLEGDIMLKNKLYLALVLLLGINLVGCSGSDTNNNQPDEAEEVFKPTKVELTTITVEVRTEEGYTTLKLVNDTDELRTILDILEKADWEENIQVEMALPPEYRFRLNSSNYAIWITPNGDRLEIIIEGEAKYIKLPQSQSEILFEIITGNELNKQKLFLNKRVRLLNKGSRFLC
ncbi:inorganic diphosphatase [Halalkalibacter urbisdiaboli]|uniref:inorganic diphosphatase n=1 Tax=Halalkalibacter urbisdiaboli TaxID=1960589 RepID=UPI000B4515E3|nr:inorganic diphosphatase [Halalkalibacter urbisdiaboli]